MTDWEGCSSHGYQWLPEPSKKLCSGWSVDCQLKIRLRAWKNYIISLRFHLVLRKVLHGDVKSQCSIQIQSLSTTKIGQSRGHLLFLSHPFLSLLTNVYISLSHRNSPLVTIYHEHLLKAWPGSFLIKNCWFITLIHHLDQSFPKL